MTSQAPPLSPSWSADLETMIRQVRDETLTFASISLGALALALLGYGITRLDYATRIGVIVALAFIALAVVWWLRLRHATVAAWTLAGSLLLIDLLVVAWLDLPAVIVLLILPVGWVALMISRTAGAVVAGLCTGIVLWLQPLPASLDLRVIAVIAVWSTLALIWLTLRPLLTAVQWAWSGYENGQSVVEQAQEYLVQLQEALKDLAEANVQLTRLNQQSQALRQIAEDSRHSKEQFAANVSHELRTPLNMIIGFCEMIMQTPEMYGDGIPPALLADLAVVLRNGQHLASLVDDVLDLSQVDAGLMALTKERVALETIIQAARIAVGPLFTAKGLYLRIDVPADLPQIFCDRTRIREVLLNLLSNAGRFSESGGVMIRAWREGDDVVTSVEDTGPGISETDQGKLFRPFEQIDGSIRRRFGGTGLGLSISKSFVELHAGKMWVKSTLGMGTAFFFSLPIDPPVPATTSVKRWLNPYVTHERRVRPSRLRLTPVKPRMVVMEHGDILQRLLARYVEGAEIVPVNDIEGARHALASTPAEVLLLNAVNIGRALDQVNASGDLPYGTPAIVCSIPGLEEAASGLGVRRYLVKPVAREKLLAALDGLGADIKTIMVVDDEVDAQQLFRRMLATSERNYRVLRASDGRQALELMHSEHPDVVLLDLIMPEMNGFKFLEAKSMDVAVRDIPVILVSAQDPFGQPIVSSALAVTCRDGLTARQLLDCIEALNAILATASQPVGPEPQAAIAG